jgi:hypothetical protein
MTHPYADIRRALVDGIRGNPDKSPEVKRWAEILISIIDGDGTDEAFQTAYAQFVRAAEGAPVPIQLSPAEIAKAFGLGEGGA